MKKTLLALLLLPSLAQAQTANDLVQVWLAQAGKTAAPGDYTTCQPEGQADGICTWNAVALGAQPTDTQLQALIPAWQAIAAAGPVPKAVSRAQAFAALNNAGLLAKAQAAVNAAPDANVSIFWNNSSDFRRDSPSIAAIGQALGMTPAQIDALFIAAAKINP